MSCNKSVKLMTSYEAQAGCSIYLVEHLEHCSVFSLLYMRATMHYYIISYSHNKAYNDSLLFVYLSMLLQRFYSLILPNSKIAQ
jgi:hypothetical protein